MKQNHNIPNAMQKQFLIWKFIEIHSYLWNDKTSNKQPNLIPKATKERKTNNTKREHEERNLKIRAEVN